VVARDDNMREHRTPTAQIGLIICYGEKNVLQSCGFKWWRDVDHINEIKAGKSKKFDVPEYWEVRTDEAVSDDELRLIIEQPPCVWCRETQEYVPCTLEESQANVEGFDYRSPNPFKTNPRSTRDIMRFRLQQRLKRQAKIQEALGNKGHKACRMKACNGRAHKAHIDPATGKPEKCPVMSGLGKKGGKGGTGASKARKGAKNGRSKGGPKKRRQTAARLKSGEIKIQTGPVETRDPFDYYRKNLDKGASQ